MSTCPMCGGTFPEGARFCPQDGAVLQAGASPDPLVGRLLDGRYRMEARLGEGGMGTVYRATHVLIGRPVAVKVMRTDLSARPDLALRFRREAMLTSRLDHEHCVRVTDVSPEGSTHAYLVMELLEGEDLQRVLRRGTLPPRRAVEIAASVAAALAHAHDLGVVHRDLKPENVFLHHRGGREVVKVVDFGVARGDYAETITRAGEVFGTPQYMSPEQASDPSRVDLRTDLYALGATIFTALAGRSPVGEAASHRILSLVAAGEIERHPRRLAPEVPEWLDALVAQCLAHAPKERPSSAAELEDALRRGLATMAPDPRLHAGPPVASDPVGSTHVAGADRSLSGERSSELLTADPRADTVVLDDGPALSQAPTRIVDDDPRSSSRSSTRLASAFSPLSASPVPSLASPGEPPRPHRIPPAEASASGSPPAEATERRQLTVLVAELSNLAELMERLDVDDVREVLRAFRAACEEVVTAAGGQVTRSIDSGMLAYLGHPRAHEDDAARAVDAALEVVERVRALEIVLPGGIRVDLAVGLGLHSGQVLVEQAGADITLVGTPPAVAARLSRAAAPGEVVVSEATHALVEGVFRCEGRREQTIPGLSRPIATYRVLEAIALGTRFARRLGGVLPPFVGRRREVEMLRDLWQSAREGSGQVVLLSGDAGIGKSRVVQELKPALLGAPHTLLEMQCWEHQQGSALWPVIQLVDQALGLGPGARDEARLDAIDALLRDHGMDVAATAPLLAGLLSIRDAGRHPPRELGLLRRKEETYGALCTLLLRLADRQPLVLVAEDLHWADPSTLELLGLVVDQAPSSPMLVVGTLRPEATLALAARPHVIRLPLGRLSVDEATALLTGVAGKPLPPELVARLIERTDGMPLFVEESARMVLESGALVEGEHGFTLADRGGGDPRAAGPTGRPLGALVPATLRDSLMARLDRLSTAKETAQRASVIGRELSFGLLHALSPGDAGALQGELRKLVSAGLLLQKGLGPDATYRFKHALVQDTAYGSLSRRRQQQIHQDVARALEQSFPAVVETQPELVAHHYAEAGLAVAALGYWVRAGQRAFERSAHVEAGGHFRRALDLLAGLPATPERDQRERAVQVALGASLMATQGYAGPDVARAYDRARELAGHGGDVRDRFPALRGTWLYYSARGAFDSAAELVLPMLAMAEPSGDRALLLQALYPAGVNAFHRGDLAAAERDLRRALSLYDKEEERRLPQRYGLADPGVGALSYLGAILWLTGHPDEGLARSKEAVELARDLRQPFSVAYASYGVAWLHQLRREPEAALTWAEATLEVATRERFPFWMRMAMMPRAWARAVLAGPRPPLDEVRAALAGYRATGAELLRTPQDAAAAELCLAAGEIVEGLALCAGALDVGVAKGERFFRAELLRIEAELLSAHGDTEDAEVARTEARREAQRIGAVALAARVG